MACPKGAVIMPYDMIDQRQPLEPKTMVIGPDDLRYEIDECVARGAACLTYLAHCTDRAQYVLLKEVYPVEPGILVKRDRNGRIGLYDPNTNTPLSKKVAVIEQFSECLTREASALRKLGTVYQPNGRAHFCSSNVPHTDGPFTDTRGNTYLAVDAAYGQTLRQFIEAGFSRDVHGTVERNERLEKVLEILAQTADRLHKMHLENRMLHLGIAPESILVTGTENGAVPTAQIIDCSSACPMNGSLPVTRWVCNSCSAPEVAAMAGSNGGAEEHFLPSADTYSLAAILFYALTGHYPAGYLHFDLQWRQRLRRSYPASLYPGKNGECFADRLIRLLETALAEEPEARFTGADALACELRELRPLCRENGSILSKLTPDELMSFVILDRFPLYNYRSRDGDLHVLCLGSGVFVKRMVLTLLSAGQMIGSHLFIHIVSSEPEASFRAFLRTQAPELKNYSRFNDDECPEDQEYVTFSYEQVPNLLTKKAAAGIASRCSDARYIVISLGTDAKNAKLAKLYSAALTEHSAKEDGRAIILYHLNDAALEEDLRGTLPPWLRVAAFGADLAACRRAVASLAQRTLKLAYLYDKLFNPRQSVAQTLRANIDNEYNQRNSCASALHLRYKLAAVGISPKTNIGKAADAYQRKLRTHSGKLLELEHRRWLMFMIADSYQPASVSELRRYGFEAVGDGFNGSWKYKPGKRHHCLVPCDDRGIRLSTTPHEQWDSYRSLQSIDASDYDPLDKMSLKVHLLAKEKCSRILEHKSLEHQFGLVEDKLDRREKELAPDDEAARQMIEQTRKLFENTRAEILALANTMQYQRKGRLVRLESAFADLGIDIGSDIRRLEQLLSVFEEFAAYRDYKAPDKTIIDNLLWVLYSDAELTVIKPAGRTIADNIAGPLVLNPRNLIYLGVEPAEKTKYDRFFAGQGLLPNTVCEPFCAERPEKTYVELTKVLARTQGTRVVDVTGCNELVVCAALRAAQASDGISVIRSAGSGINEPIRIDDLYGFAAERVYTMTPAVSAKEIYGLYGAKEKTRDSTYMMRLFDEVPKLWELYQKNRGDWFRIAAFFQCRANNTCEMLLNAEPPFRDWTVFSQNVSRRVWDSINFHEVFRKLENAGVIRGLSWSKASAGKYEVRFEYREDWNARTQKAFTRFFSGVNDIAFPLECTVSGNLDGGYAVRLDSGTRCSIFDHAESFVFRSKNAPDVTIFYRDVFPVLDELQRMGLIYSLKHSETNENGSRTTKCSFIYADPALQECLATAGNILELYTWYEAVQTGYFDECRPNFYFAWENGTENELDVILTKGLSSLIVSCKTSKFNANHLYEIDALTRKFSLNSTPVIIYSSRQGFVDGVTTDDLCPIKNRASAMGIYLIDLNELEAQGISLGEKLVRIIEGRDQP